MKLTEFIEQFIEHNSLIRLLYKEKGGHKIVLNDWNEVSMEHEILNNKGKYKSFKNHEVLGITSILAPGPYSEAINIVIKEIDIKDIRKEKLEKIHKL